RVLLVESRPPESQRFEWRGPSVRRHLCVVSVDRVGQQWSMTRDAYLLCDRWTTLDPNLLFHVPQRFGLTFEFCRLPFRIELFTIDVLHVRDEMRHAPRNMTIAPRDDERQSRDRRADDVRVAGFQMCQVPHRRNTRTQVRIVCQYRSAGNTLRARDNPCIRSQPAMIHSAD